MAIFNKHYKYLTCNRCDDCEKYYPKELAILDDNGVIRCHYCNQRLRLKPRNNMSAEIYNNNNLVTPYRPFVEFIYCTCGCGKTRPKYIWLNRERNYLWRNKLAQYIKGHSLIKKEILK